jgi:intracellular septation protein A
MNSAIGLVMWTYKRDFVADGLPCRLLYRAGFKATESILLVCDVEHDRQYQTNFTGDGLVNHHLSAILPTGRRLSVEAGYINWINIAHRADVDGIIVHESHPGLAIVLPENIQAVVKLPENQPSLREQFKSGMQEDGTDLSKLYESRWAICIDLVSGLVFFFVAKAFGLTTAALVGAVFGIALVIAQRFVKVDILGGMVTFGIVMLMLSAAFSLYFQDDWWIKQKSTIIGLIGATCFLVDGAMGGRWLGQGMSRYLAYGDIDVRRLALGMGMVGVMMALLNVLAVRMLSTDGWLFYTTFVDIVIVMIMGSMAIQWSRKGSRKGSHEGRGRM